MKRLIMGNVSTMILTVILVMPQIVYAIGDEPVKWYGIGGELNDPNRWLGRIGMNEYLGVEVIFALEHISVDCRGDQGDCDLTTLSVGGGVIYDLVPGAKLSPYLAGRLILNMTGDGDSETSGTVEAASGIEYVLMDRLGLSGELNFSFNTDPTHVLTSTIVRFYFYF